MKYLGNDVREDVESQFQVTLDDNINLLLWNYEYANYEGYAFVLFEQNGRLYEVNGSHCSCYGLEGQWDPEETSVEELKFRMDKGNLGNGHDGIFAPELREILSEW